MSGHSKWANIKHRKAKGDAQKANVFTKIGRELALAVKNGGADPNLNSKLKDVIVKAKAANMPNDNISRSIKKASGELNSINYEEMVYEGYGANGIAVIVEALTDNKNRTAGDVRHIFDKCGGAMGTSGCVSYMFNKKGVIVVDKQDLSEDDLMLMAIDAGADDVITEEEIYEIYTAVASYGEVKDNLEKSGLNILSASIEYIPDIYNDVTEETQVKIEKLIDMLDDLDDVTNIYHNANLN